MKCEICPVKEECEKQRKNLEQGEKLLSVGLLGCPLSFAITEWVNFLKKFDRLAKTDMAFKLRLEAWAKGEIEEL